ncbi:nucleotidyl transferase AbiEii/AbiGii toxin family protein [Nocardia ninae]|uniref:Nucleotidyl transferase AbiEii/AbiGii toxin family protein n=1 Tax=Nocardia ninae NBRC 108245 TaxID=1210091 RepID=A0A511MDA2_9NOCA|nr:nucleotidyl transferase AbiEii/AbiGii toxin family protein [Nocardia ninae]GEM38655.1 hypothetical protein NN4_31740 [Nocardia ninae NBRC 108245]
MTFTYKTGVAFKTALSQRIRNQADATNRLPSELQREFFMQRFLARVFAEPDAPWMVKGGGGLLVRIPGARHSKDIDLVHREADLDQALAELQQLCAHSRLDPFLFQLEVRKRLRGMTSGVELSATAFFGTTLLARPFPIDLAVHRELVGEVDYIAPPPIVEIPGVAKLPAFAVYPLADQIADKVAAMYEMHGTTGATASTRWRDLVDLLLITHRFPLDAAKTRAAIEGQRRRRGITLPTTIQSPGLGWEEGYRRLAQKTVLPRGLHQLAAALESVGECLNPLLDGTVTEGRWNPSTRRWERSAVD